MHIMHTSIQVPLLLSMQREFVSLRAAVESGDPDLLAMTMMHIKRKRSVHACIHVCIVCRAYD